MTPRDPKERPILFSGPMVRAILDGRKTQTRRVMKEPWQIRLPLTVRGDWPFQATWAAPGIYEARHNRQGAVSVVATSNGELLGVKPDEFEWVCPYGAPGDRLWVREAFTGDWRGNGEPSPSCINYRADSEIPEQYIGNAYWRPSIHMPRWASRITLEVTGVRVQRLCDISEDDARAEGLRAVRGPLDTLMYEGDAAYGQFADPRVAYRLLWDSINATRGYSWDSEPWVWAIAFRMVQP